MARSPSEQGTTTVAGPFVKSLGLLFGLIATAMLGWNAIESAGRVDGHEFDLLDSYLEPALTQELTVLDKSRSDPTPCWLWCEDYLLNVETTWVLELPDSTDGAEVCQTLTDVLSSHIGRPPDQATEHPAQACVLTWTGLEWADRELTVRAEVQQGRPSTATVVATNASTERGSPL